MHTIVSQLLENGFDSYGSSSGVAFATYTLESGATIIARECAQELHELFEVGIVETNEAVLAAYTEGYTDVTESVTYGPVFEAAEKKFGEKVMDFLKKLWDRIKAFFKSIGAKLTLLVGNYDKWWKENGAKVKEKKALTDCPVIDWVDAAIDQVSDKIAAEANYAKENVDLIIGVIQEMADTEIKGDERESYEKNFKNLCDKWITATAKSLGIEVKDGEYETTTMNKDLEKTFRKKDKKKTTVDAAYVEVRLKGTKKTVEGIKKAQKNFDSSYKEIIKTIKKITDDMERGEKKGYTQYINKVTSTLSKTQGLVNAYASAGYRATVGRANEAKMLAHCILNQKKPKDKDND